MVNESGHSLRCDLHLIPEDVYFNDAVAFEYGDSMQREVRNKRGALLGDQDPLYMFAEKKGADDNSSRNTNNAEMSKHRDENSAMEVRSHYSMEATVQDN